MNWYRSLKIAQTQYAPSNSVGKTDVDEYTTNDPYGYWVTTDAQLIPVLAWEGHSETLYDQSGRSQAQAFEQGWVRLRVHGVCAIEATRLPTPQQLAAIMGVFRRANAVHCDTVYLDLPGLRKSVPAKFLGNFLKSQNSPAPVAVTAAVSFGW